MATGIIQFDLNSYHLLDTFIYLHRLSTNYRSADRFGENKISGFSVRCVKD